MTTQNTKLYQLKVGIAGAQPPIWRRVQVPARCTLADLHTVIQALMGWHDNHLHEFEVPIGKEASPGTRRSRRNVRRFGPTTDPSGQPFNSPEYALDWLANEDLNEDEAQAVLEDTVPHEKARFLYIYDMGDNWEHEVLVEKILPADPAVTYPLCLTGKRSGPLEDLGGIDGYEEALEILADSAHPQHKQIKAWLKKMYGVSAWDGAAFDLAQINKRLSGHRK